MTCHLSFLQSIQARVVVYSISRPNFDSVPGQDQEPVSVEMAREEMARGICVSRCSPLLCRLTASVQRHTSLGRFPKLIVTVILLFEPFSRQRVNALFAINVQVIRAPPINSELT
ncbi:hypothetical protein ADM96_15630 [Burkholderia sp. ST111]|nr:hypothetical protein ADM96_15630 [Burkholderia sp. ST111]